MKSKDGQYVSHSIDKKTQVKILEKNATETPSRRRIANFLHRVKPTNIFTNESTESQLLADPVRSDSNLINEEIVMTSLVLETEKDGDTLSRQTLKRRKKRPDLIKIGALLTAASLVTTLWRFSSHGVNGGAVHTPEQPTKIPTAQIVNSEERLDVTQAQNTDLLKTAYEKNLTIELLNSSALLAPPQYTKPQGQYLVTYKNKNGSLITEKMWKVSITEDFGSPDNMTKETLYIFIPVNSVAALRYINGYHEGFILETLRFNSYYIQSIKGLEKNKKPYYSLVLTDILPPFMGNSPASR